MTAGDIQTWGINKGVCPLVRSDLKEPYWKNKEKRI